MRAVWTSVLGDRKFSVQGALLLVRRAPMGELISLDSHRHGHPSRPPRTARFSRATFSFDLALPGTYFAAERVERFFAGVRWQPVSAVALAAALDRDPYPDTARAEQRAAQLGVPLVWPDPYPADGRVAMRAAAVACELGRGAPFVLAATRLAFCGGFDLCDPEVLAEAAAAAGLPLDVCLAAVHDHARDAHMQEAGLRLAALGAEELPALRIGRRLFSGERRLPEALAAVTAAAHQPAAG